MLTPQWSEGFNPDVSAWLNARGYEANPTEINMRGRGGVTAKRVEAQRPLSAAESGYRALK